MKAIHATGLMPPSFGPVKTWCGRRVPIEQTLHHPPLNELCGGSGKVTCKTCKAKQRKRAAFWDRQIRRKG